MQKFFRLNLLLSCIILIFSSCFKQAAVKSFQKNKKNAPYDAIIVPGYPFQDTVWHDIMKIRVYWSHYLYDKGYANNIIYSGNAVYSPYIEAEIMKRYGMALGVPAEHIYTEPLAKHSTENLYYSYQLAKLQGFEKVAVATDPFQNVLLKRFAKKNKIDVDFIPIVFDTLSQIEKTDPEIDPSSAYVENFVPLPERVGFFKRLRGTLGYNINPNLYSTKRRARRNRNID